MTLSANPAYRCDLCARRVPIKWTYVTPNKCHNPAEAERKNLPWFAGPDWGVCAECDEIITHNEGNEGMMMLYRFSVTSQTHASMVISIGMSPDDLQEMESALAKHLLDIIATFWNNWTERHPEPGYREPL
jgi:hypothetical protein